MEVAQGQTVEFDIHRCFCDGHLVGFLTARGTWFASSASQEGGRAFPDEGLRQLTIAMSRVVHERAERRIERMDPLRYASPRKDLQTRPVYNCDASLSEVM
jgi:hypothetical protein